MKAIQFLFLLSGIMFLTSQGECQENLIRVPSEYNISRLSSSDSVVIIPIGVLYGYDYEVDVLVDNASTARKGSYSLLTKKAELKATPNDTMIKVGMAFHPDTIARTKQQVVLQLKVKSIKDKKDTVMINRLVIVSVTPYKQSENVLEPGMPIKWLVGANFDFLDGLHAEHLYSSVDIFRPRVAGKVGFHVVLNRNRYGSLDSSFTKRTVTYTQPAGPDSMLQIKESYNWKSNTTYNTLGISIAPNFSVYANQKTGFNFLLHGYLGGLQFKKVSRNTYTPISKDSTMIAGNLTINDFRRPVSSRNFYNTYFGGGVTLVNRVKSVEILWSATVGAGNNRDVREFQTFYLVQMNLTELTSGFTLGGELRAFMPNEYPLISIYLAKAFDVKKIGDALAK